MPLRDGARVVLRFVGPRRDGSPARDLTRSDVHRIAYRRQFAATGVRPVITEDDIRQTTTALVARGSYKRMKKES